MTLRAVSVSNGFKGSNVTVKAIRPKTKVS
jgi:hypothetical protein